MWTPFEFEFNGQDCDAKLRKGALVYRLTSVAHTDRECLLSGLGAGRGSHHGRFNLPGQNTSYCASNALVGFAEVLFHMYRRTLSAISNRLDRGHIVRSTQAKKCLLALRLEEIPKLVYTDAMGVSDYDSRLCGAAVVFPDPHYEFMQTFNTKLREKEKRGILYPSARHSVGLCVAFFHDETKSIAECSEPISVRLQLLPEHQALDKAPEAIDPFQTKIHPTMGYYQIISLDAVKRAQQSGMLPDDLPLEGKIDFVCRNYRNEYPAKAVVS